MKRAEHRLKMECFSSSWCACDRQVPSASRNADRLQQGNSVPGGAAQEQAIAGTVDITENLEESRPAAVGAFAAELHPKPVGNAHQSPGTFARVVKIEKSPRRN